MHIVVRVKVSVPKSYVLTPLSRRLRVLIVSSVSVCVSSACTWSEEEKITPIVPRTESKPPLVPLGLNLGSLNYYSPTLPFIDVMKNASEPTTTGPSEGGPWDTELIDRVPLDPDGYPLEVPYAGEGVSAPQWVRYAVVNLTYAGRYTLLYDGDGEFAFPPVPVEVVSRSAGAWQLDVPKRDGSLFVTITRSSRSNHVRNLRLLLPGFTREAAQMQVFHPQFLERIHGASVLRFMDWQRTNDSTLTRWADRATPERVQGTARGVALETILELANRANADPWLCLPHGADDDFVERTATLVRERLRPDRVVYIEYSNELWNVVFEQADYVQQQGCAAGLERVEPKPGACSAAVGRMWAGTKWSAQRSAQIFAIFERVFGGTQRLVRVLGGQAANAARNEVLLEAFNDSAINPRGVRADALAIAPYFGNVVGALTEDESPRRITVEELLDRAEESIETQVRDATHDNKRVADLYGVRLVAYEGGQHLVASGALADDEALTDKLIAANRDPRMAVLYRKMFDAWYSESGNDLLVLFNSAELPGKHGSWGLLESQDEPTERAPKYRAFRERLTALATHRP